MAAQLNLIRDRTWGQYGRLMDAQDERIKELEIENASLRMELEAARNQVKLSTPLHDHQRLITKYNDLRVLNRDLRQKYDRCVLDFAEKHKESKERIRAWQKYLAAKGHVTDKPPKHDDGSSGLNAIPVAPTVGINSSDNDAEVATPEQPSAAVPGATSNLSAGHGELVVNPATNTPNAGPPGEKADSGAAPQSSSASTRCESSQATEVVTQSSPPSRDDDLGDEEPEVVSARPVKRKRRNSSSDMPPPVRIKQEPIDSDIAIEIHSDHYSSPKGERTRLNHAGSSDLDALLNHVKTPRKPKTRKENTSADGQQTSVPATTTLHAVQPEPAKPGDAETCLKLERSGGTASANKLHEWHASPPSRSTIKRKKIKVEPTTDHCIAAPAVAGRECAPISSVNASGILGTTLTPLSPNIPTAIRSRDSARDSKRHRRSDDSMSKALMLSEGGEDESQENRTSTDQTPQAKINRQRLGDLLERPTPGREALTKRSTPETTSIKCRERDAIKARGRATAASTPLQHNAKPTPPTKPPSPAKPEDEPLRCRPLKSLRLDDFRINPQYMNADYAFSETVRGKAARRCLPGCTRQECCGGAFLKAVELGAHPSANGKSDADHLEAFLGPDWEGMMGAYEPDKRKDLLLQARAFALANAHGKHRAAFERHSTPPGFWRTDMPTTQEEREDRERAREMERSKVEERWREAMREGGRWRFRDEVNARSGR